MKKIYAILVAALFVVSGCANIFRDELTELHDQMSEILAMVDRANNNLETVQALLEVLRDYDYIKNIEPLMENGVEIGYTITFTSRGTVNIYHGQTPLMGVKEDDDGIWY